jgi:hypothetical protein
VKSVLTINVFGATLGDDSSPQVAIRFFEFYFHKATLFGGRTNDFRYGVFVEIKAVIIRAGGIIFGHGNVQSCFRFGWCNQRLLYVRGRRQTPLRQRLCIPVVIQVVLGIVVFHNSTNGEHE